MLQLREKTSAKKIMSYATESSNHNYLTLLPDRTMFYKKLSYILERIESHEKLAVVLIDIDNFKHINDIFGYGSGDKVLTEISERLIGLSKGKFVVSKAGGDEFFLIINNQFDRTVLKSTVKDIIKEINKPIYIDGFELSITVSVGISIYPENGKSIDLLIKNSEAAMYYSKELCKNGFQLYRPQIRKDYFTYLKTENSIKKALEQNEFEIYYQPKINLKTAHIDGAEALVRWNHKELGIILPSDFIPIAEKSGLIIPLGEWILSQVCSQNKIWEDKGLKLPNIAVNFSALQLKSNDIIYKINRFLNRSKLELQCLELEITESFLINDFDNVNKILSKLRDMNIRITLDDFGTGYSSLNYLKNINIDSLKLDKSFIKHIAFDNKNKAIVNAIIQMAHALKLTIVAEGVETKEQLHCLKGLRCDLAQGYIFSKPLPVDEFEKLLLSKKNFSDLCMKR